MIIDNDEYFEFLVKFQYTDKADIGTVMEYIKESPLHDSEIDSPVGSYTLNKNCHVTGPNEYWKPCILYIVTTDKVCNGDHGLGFATGIKGVGRGHYTFYHDGSNVSKLNAICENTFKIVATYGSNINLPVLNESTVKNIISILNSKVEGKFYARKYSPDITEFKYIIEDK